MTQPTMLFAACLSALIGAGCSSESSESKSHTTPDPAITVDAVLAEYSEYRAMTDGPVPIDSALWADCRPMSEVMIGSRKKFGPHAEFFAVFFMNPPAANNFKSGDPPYPPGSVIVKEKQSSYFDDEMSGPGMAGMIKREPGYDPNHGDWEYFFVDDDTPLAQGKLPSCIDCHQRVADRDYVFGDWAGRAGR